jgi:lipopolysaccharide heptosyltransferase II
MSVSEPERILLVTKPRYIGDTVLGTAAFRAVATRFPQAEIDLLTGGPGAEAMRGCPFLREIKVVDRARRRHPLELWRAAVGLRGYDLAVIFDRSLRSALTCRLARIPNRVGFAAELRRPLLTKAVPYDRSLPELDCLLAVSSAAGAPPAGRDLQLWVSGEERDQATRQFSLAGRSFVTFAPAANEPYVRQWPAKSYVAVGRAMADRGFVPVLLGAPTELDASREVYQGLQDCALNLAGLTSVREALQLIAASALFVSGEIGLSHCAVALGTPSVIVHGPTKARRWGHETAWSKALWVPARTDAPRPEEIHACVEAVAAEMVLEAAGRVMKQVNAVAT